MKTMKESLQEELQETSGLSSPELDKVLNYRIARYALYGAFVGYVCMLAVVFTIALLGIFTDVRLLEGTQLAWVLSLLIATSAVWAAIVFNRVLRFKFGDFHAETGGRESRPGAGH